MDALLRRILALRFGITGDLRVRMGNWCVLRCASSVQLREPHDRSGTETIRREYQRFAAGIHAGVHFPPPMLVHPNVLRDLGARATNLYCVDGMHRIVSTATAGVPVAEVLVIVRRCDLSPLIGSQDLERITTLNASPRWFGAYQELSEFGLHGLRKQATRYRDIYDFGELKGRTVVDYACNAGQATLEATFRGAAAYGFDIQPEVIDLARAASSLLGLSTQYVVVDNNPRTAVSQVRNTVSQWDVLLFLALYRTKEVEDIRVLFAGLVSHTKDVVYFEGHADPAIDTVTHYMSEFATYGLCDAEFLGHSDGRPAFRIAVSDASRERCKRIWRGERK